MARLRITYTKSAIGYNVKQKLTIQALGLRRLHQVVEHDDSPVIRGMKSGLQPCMGCGLNAG